MTSQNEVLARWNSLPPDDAVREVVPCCGSRAWAEQLALQRPFLYAEDLFAASDGVWLALPEADWNEAFDSHPRIGQQHARTATAQSLSWSSSEQSAVTSSEDEAARFALAEGNRDYEAKFGRIFLVCASGRSTSEILSILRSRIGNTPEQELVEATEQQRQITHLRLRRWLSA